MKRLIVLIGESGSGKTTIISELVRRHPDKFKKIVTCTSRPKRDCEIEGLDYNFYDEEYFIDNQNLVLNNSTSEGFYYGTERNNLCVTTHNLLLSLRTKGVKSLIDNGYNNIIVVQISINDQLKINRMQQRGDTEDMISKRMIIDSENRTEFYIANTQVIKIDAAQKLEENINTILKHIKE